MGDINHRFDYHKMRWDVVGANNTNVTELKAKIDAVDKEILDVRDGSIRTKVLLDAHVSRIEEIKTEIKRLSEFDRDLDEEVTSLNSNPAREKLPRGQKAARARFDY